MTFENKQHIVISNMYRRYMYVILHNNVSSKNFNTLCKIIYHHENNVITCPLKYTTEAGYTNYKSWIILRSNDKDLTMI